MFRSVCQRLVSILAWGCLAISPLHAADKISPDGVWELIDQVPAEKAAATPNIRPAQGQRVEINAPKLWDILDSAPLEFSKAASTPAVISLPMPEGGFAKFYILDSPIMEAELAEEFPEIRTCVGWGIDDPEASLRLDWTINGFHAQVLSPRGAFYIDPYSMHDPQYYTSYYKRDYRNKSHAFECLLDTKEVSSGGEPPAKAAARTNGTQLRTYRLANAATGEYTAFHGGTVPQGQAAIVTAVNRVVGIYEKDLSIRLVLVANNSNLVFTNAGTDPYDNDDPNLLLDQNQTRCDSAIGSANYDIGHVFSTGGGGLAGLGVVCRNGLKAQGETGSPSPINDPFYVDYVAHEMGHQFGANHTFNGSGGSCGGNRESTAAYEPGSGSTIMAYAGICGSDDLQNNSDPYFHFRSIDEILAYTIDGLGNGCPVNTATGNTPPTINAGADYSIPIGTPFILTASASDTNGDTLTYCWEQADLGGSAALNAADNGSIPLFRSFNPSSSPARTFPRLSNIINNISSDDEKLPSVSRPSMDFRCTVRDNRINGGGIADDSVFLNVVAAAGPFLVTFPNAAATHGGNITVTWNVANTTAAPISTANVRILLSTDGGLTFPVTLLASTTNDGTQSVSLPAINTTTARIKVEAVGNIYFDLSNANFTIVPASDFELTGNTTIGDNNAAGNNNGTLEPGEAPVDISPQIRNSTAGGITSISGVLSTNTPGVSIVNASAAYPDLGGNTSGYPLTPFQIAISDQFTCGDPINFTLTVSGGSGAALLFSLPTGVPGQNTTATYSATGLPLSIPDPGTINSTVTVPATTGAISKIRVLNVVINHTYSEDLDLELISPAGTNILLSSANGGNADNTYANTIFDDAAGTAIGTAGTPYTGSYRPDESLSGLNGEVATGIWTLRVIDTFAVDSGALNGWTLEVTTNEGPYCAPLASGVAHPELYE